MARAAPPLIVDIATNVARLQEDMRRAVGAVEGGVRDISRSVGTLKGAFASVLGATGAGLIGREMIQAATQAEQASSRLQATLRATGFSAGLTKQQLDDMAESLARSTQFDDDGIRNAQSQLLKFGNIHGKVFSEALKLSTDLAAFMGSDVPEAAQMIGRSLQSPTEGLTLMERQFGKLTEAEEAHIKSLAAQGKAIEAQNAVLDLWRQKVGATAEAMNTGLTKATTELSKSWDDLLKAMGRSEAVGGTVAHAFGGAASVLRDVQKELEGTRTHLRGFFIEFPAEKLANLPGALGMLGKFGIAMAARERADMRSTGQAPGRPTELKDWLEPGPPSNVVLGGRTSDDAEAKRLAVERERELARLRALGAKSEEEYLRAQQDQIDFGDQLIRLEVERNKKELERLAALGHESEIQYMLAQHRALEERDDILRAQRLREREEGLKAIAKQEEAAAKASAEHAREAQRAWERTADNIERSLVDSIMRGGKSGLDYLKDAMRTAILTPIIQPLVRPLAQAGASLAQAGMGLFFGGGGGGVGAPGYGGGVFGGADILNIGGIAGMGASAMGGMGSATAAGSAALAGFGAAVPYLAGGALLLSALAEDEGDAQRTGRFVQPFGEARAWPTVDERWFSGSEMGGSLAAFGSGVAAQEQNLIRNLGLAPGQIASVQGSLQSQAFGREYGFGMEHTDWMQSGAPQQIMADRLQAISSALGRSIEELTQIMSMSAEQWQAAIGQLEQGVQRGEQALAQFARGLPGQLGITALEDYQNNLALSEFQSPLDRFAAAREQLSQSYARASGGDLTAVQAFPQVLQSALGVGRDVYASGAPFQDLFLEGNRMLQEVLDKQRAVQADLLKDLPVTIMQAANDQIAELRSLKAALVSALDEVKTELRRMQAA